MCKTTTHRDGEQTTRKHVAREKIYIYSRTWVRLFVSSFVFHSLYSRSDVCDCVCVCARDTPDVFSLLFICGFCFSYSLVCMIGQKKKLSLVILRKQTLLVLHRLRARGVVRLRSFAPDNISCIHTSRTVSAVDAPLFVLRCSVTFFFARCSRIVCITRRRRERKKKTHHALHTQYLKTRIVMMRGIKSSDGI